MDSNNPGQAEKQTHHMPELPTYLGGEQPEHVSTVGRAEKVPVTSESTLRPGQTRFASAISLAAEAGPATPSTYSDSVWNA